MIKTKLLLICCIVFLTTTAHAEFVEYDKDYTYELNTQAYRNGKYEQGSVIRTKATGHEQSYMYKFLTKPTVKDIDIMLAELIVRLETPAPEPEVYINVKEVEAILKDKELIETTEDWEDFKEKTKPNISETP